MLGLRRRLRAVGQSVLGRVWPRQAPTILMYHRIAQPAYDPWGLSVSPARFSEQLSWLKRSRKLLHVDSLVEGMRSGGLTGNEIAITFDDGYVDNLLVAKPILQRAQAPATVFITTDRLGTQREFWWDELANMCLGGTAAVDAEVEIAGQRLHVALSAREAATPSNWFWSDPPPTARERTYLTLWQALQGLDEATRETCMHTLRQQFGEPIADAASWPMCREDVAELVSGGLLRVGGHARDHLRLTTLSAAEKRLQIEHCKRDLEELTRGLVAGFAYPFGDRDDETKALARAAGYDWAVSTHEAAIDARGYDAFDLPRIQAMNWSGSELLQKLAELGRP
jgi:peptidoglycan/xylan/chitin deacetylase (PgdA/CDA1 family)